MKARQQPRWRWAFSLALTAAIGCGSAEEADQPAQAFIPSLPTEATSGNATSLVVAMSMVLPKKPPPMIQMTAPPLPQAPPGVPGAPGFGVPPAAPTGPGAPAGVAGAAAPPPPPVVDNTPAGPNSAAGADISGVPAADVAMLRELCVAEINMYRATLTAAPLKPITRATPEQEECSQKGAKMDGDTMSAHGAARAGLCSSLGLGAENTCPGWQVGGNARAGGSATLADALKSCLKAMWAEGQPPMGRDACIADGNCFQMHGHYLNMSDPNISSAACSFYKMSDGVSYWMNQDFTSNIGGAFGRM